jgi:p-aminobenzoyl-glutamate transporter AbgT
MLFNLFGECTGKFSEISHLNSVLIVVVIQFLSAVILVSIAAAGEAGAAAWAAGVGLGFTTGLGCGTAFGLCGGGNAFVHQLLSTCTCSLGLPSKIRGKFHLNRQREWR